jgi:hypothetical protein
VVSNDYIAKLVEIDRLRAILLNFLPDVGAEAGII